MRFMTVQTIPSIEEMTGAQRVELMEELWKAMSKRPEDIEVPERHRRILEERREAVDRGEIDYIDWEEAKRQIRSQIK
jgi:2-oxoglutarate dehydrogenase complex dehydrogenase (E1) component-like enzyme